MASIGDIIRVAFTYRDGYGSRLVNVVNYRQELIDLAASGSEELALAYKDYWETNFGALFTNGVEAISVVTRNRNDATEGFETSVTATGAVSGESMPPADTVVVQLKTGIIGRSYRGEFNLGGVPQGANASGQVDASWKALVISTLEDAKSLGPTLQPGKFTWVVYSAKLNQANDVLDLVVSDDFGHLSSRRPGRGS